MARSSTGVSGAARPPARSSNASSRPSMGLTPVIWKVIAEHTANGGAVDDLFGGLVDFNALRILLARAVDEHHGHQVAEIFLGILQHFRGAAAVQAHRHGRTVLGIRLERGVGQLIAGHHHVALQQHRLLFPCVEQFRSPRARVRCWPPRADCWTHPPCEIPRSPSCRGFSSPPPNSAVPAIGWRCDPRPRWPLAVRIPPAPDC